MPQGDVIGSAWIEINSNITQLQREIARLKGHVDSSARNIETRFNTATKAIAGMASVIGTVGVVKFGADIIKASTHMDSINRMLINVEGSQEKANKRFEEFRVLAKEPVLDPFNLSRFYVSLKSVNVEGDLSIRFMKSLANAMAGVGAGNTEFVRSMEQFTQMMGKATLQGQDLRVVAESFPQIRKYLGEAFGGLTDPEAIAKAGYKSIDVLTRLNEVMEKSPKFAGGAQAAQENFTQSLELFYATLGKDVLPIITDFLNKLTDLMDEFGKLDAPIKKVIGTAVVGGVGLLGIASAVGAIKIALDGLGMSAGLTRLMGLGAKTAVAGGAVAGAGIAETVRKWVPNAPGTAVSAPGYATGAYQDVAVGGAVAGGAVKALGLTIPQLMVGTIVAGVLAYKGAEILGKALGGKPATFVPSERMMMLSGEQTEEGIALRKTPAIQEEIRKRELATSRFKEYQMGAGNFPTKTLSEIAPSEDVYQGLMDMLGKDYEVWRNKTFAELERSLAIPGKMYKAEAGPPEPKKITTTTTDIMEGFKKWESIQGEGYYATIDEKIAKLKELRDAHKLEPSVLTEVNNTIKDLLLERSEIYKKTFDEWQSVLKEGYQKGLEIVTKGGEDIALRLGLQKIPVMTETGAVTVGYELPETAKRPEVRFPEKKPSVMEFMGTEDDLDRLKEWFAEQTRLAKLDEDMIALSGELARKDEEYIATIKEKTQTLDKAGISADDYAQALENIKKTTDEISRFKTELKIKPDFVIDSLDDIEIKYEELYEKADRLNVSKLMVDQAKEADVKAIYDSWAISLDRTGISMQGLTDDWDDLADSLLNVKEESKEISDFWRQMGQEGLSMIESVSDKTVESVFGKIFEKSDISEAYQDYKLSQEMIRDEDERTGRAFEKGYDLQTMSFQEFSSQYRKEAELNTQSWSEFCKSMVEEFTKALIKMEIEAEASNVFDLLSGKGYGNAGGIGGTIKSIAGMGKNKEEIAGGVAPELTTAGGISAGSAIAGAGAIAGTALWAYKVGEAGYDYWKQKQEFKEQISTPEGLSKTQLAQKDMLQQKFNVGKYENREEGIYANIKGYESSMGQLGLEPYPLAKGGMGIVTKPTPFIMGEAGPEVFNIQPLSKVQNEYITNKKDTYVSGNKSDNFNVYISFPNATLDSVDQNQIDRFVAKAVPSLRRAVSNGEL